MSFFHCMLQMHGDDYSTTRAPGHPEHFSARKKTRDQFGREFPEGITI